MAIVDRLNYDPLPPIPNTEVGELQTYLHNELVQLSNTVGELSTIDKNKIVHTHVIFNGVATPSTIFAQENVADVTRTSTGVYDITFTKETEGVFYTIMITTNGNQQLTGYTAVSTTGLTVTVTDTSGTPANSSRIHVALVGAL